MTAPIFRRLDQLTGDVAESPVGAILDTADQVCAELAEVYELRTRVQELTAENTDLAERLDSLDNAHKITLAALADARRGNTEPWHGQAVTS